MTDDSTSGKAQSGAAHDQDIIQNILNSKEWEEQLCLARLQREKVLAERARQGAESGGLVSVALTAPPKPLGEQAAVVDIRPARDSGAGKAKPMVRSASTGRRVLLGLGIGMVAGLMIGLALRPLLNHAIGTTNSSASMSADLQSPPSSPPDVADADTTAAGRADASGIAKQMPQNADPASKAAPSALSYGRAATSGLVPDSGIVGNVWPTGEPLSGSETRVVTSGRIATSLLPDSLPFAEGLSSTPPMSDTIEGDIPADLRNVPTLIVDLSYAPPSRLPPIKNLTGKPTALIGVRTLPRADPALSRRSVPLLPLPADPDKLPDTPGLVYLVGAQSYVLNVHFANPESGAGLRAQLRELGVVNVKLTPSKFAASQNMVAFYEAANATAALALARLISGAVLDLEGIAPVPPAGTLDIYLAE